jgi:hypothetical protein
MRSRRLAQAVLLMVLVSMFCELSTDEFQEGVAYWPEVEGRWFRSDGKRCDGL